MSAFGGNLFLVSCKMSNGQPNSEVNYLESRMLVDDMADSSSGHLLAPSIVLAVCQWRWDCIFLPFSLEQYRGKESRLAK